MEVINHESETKTNEHLTSARKHLHRKPNNKDYYENIHDEQAKCLKGVLSREIKKNDRICEYVNMCLLCEN